MGIRDRAEVAPEGRDGILRFAGLLPGSWLHAGANRLEVLVVEEEDDDDARLRRLRLRDG
jgi:hypothetical protein